MKNIYLLQTDKPSRLQKNKHNKLFLSEEPKLYSDCINQNIYITSDEEIKEGDWLFDLDIKRIVKADSLKVDTSKAYGCWYYKKIILTTDPYLIKDGVQAIDDNFLELFVKNPNCDKIEIKTRYLHSYKTGETFISFSKTPEFSSRNMQCIKIEPRYEIIIPQEEPNFNMKNEIEWVSNNPQCKQIESCYSSLSKKCICPQEKPKLINNCPKCGLDLVEREGSKPVCTRIDCGGIILSNETLREWALKEEPKQETLEEAAEKLSDRDGFVDGALFGAEWKSERMYSEEEVNNLVFQFYYDMSHKMKVPENLISENRTNADVWFSQFKKK